MRRKYIVLPGGRLKTKPKRHSSGERRSHHNNPYDESGKKYDRAGKLRLRQRLKEVEMADAEASLFD